jgi:hypothetical protein
MASGPAGNTEKCPFCAVSIDPDLSRFGGTCPNCLGEIPGDEAATDPGEQRRKEQAAADAKRKEQSAKRPLYLAAPALMLVVGFAAWAVLRPAPEVEALNLDDAQYWQADLDSMMVITGSAPAEAATEAPSPSPVKVKAPTVAAAGTEADPLADIGSKIQGPGPVASVGSGTRSADPGSVEGATPQVALGGGSGASSSDPFAGIGVSVQRKREKGVTLYDDNDIIEMVKSVMAVEMPKLKICYDRRLKEAPTLQGDWVLNFTVTTDGAVKNPKAAGAQTQDADLEACINEKMAAWQFQPIKADLPLRRTIRFKPN